jgi:hypothetical protein
MSQGPPSPYQQSGPHWTPEPPGQPQMGPVTTKFAKVDPGPSQTFGWLGFGMSVIGSVMVLVSYTALTWVRVGSYAFPDLHQAINQDQLINSLNSDVALVHPVAKAYFSWLGWAILVLVAVCAVLAATPALSGPFRVITPLLAAAAIALTLVAIDITNEYGYKSWIKDSGVGFYLAMVGFLLVGIGSALGTSRERRY